MSKELVIKAGTFSIAESAMIDPADAELLEELDDEDRAELQRKPKTLPIISFRGKDKKNEDGDVIFKEGDYKWYHRLIKDIPDVNGAKGLLITFILVAPQKSRVYFRENLPVCRSRDGITGVGSPGGECRKCPLSKWQNIEERNVIPCDEHTHVLTYDWTAQDFYITQWKRTAAYRFNDFLELREIEGKPFYWVKVHATQEYNKDAAFPYWQPKFDVVDVLPKEEREKVKEMRRQHRETFMQDVEAEDVEKASRDENGHGTGGQSESNELPPDVTPVNPKAQEGDLPF
jgi:hypothetical protein